MLDLTYLSSVEASVEAKNDIKSLCENGLSLVVRRHEILLAGRPEWGFPITSPCRPGEAAREHSVRTRGIGRKIRDQAMPDPAIVLHHLAKHR